MGAKSQRDDCRVRVCHISVIVTDRSRARNERIELCATHLLVACRLAFSPRTDSMVSGALDDVDPLCRVRASGKDRNPWRWRSAIVGCPSMDAHLDAYGLGGTTRFVRGRNWLK